MTTKAYETIQRILTEADKALSPGEISALAGLTRNCARHHLNNMLADGLVRRTMRRKDNSYVYEPSSPVPFERLPGGWGW